MGGICSCPGTTDWIASSCRVGCGCSTITGAGWGPRLGVLVSLVLESKTSISFWSRDDHGCRQLDFNGDGSSPASSRMGETRLPRLHLKQRGILDFDGGGEGSGGGILTRMKWSFSRQTSDTFSYLGSSPKKASKSTFCW